MKRKVSVPVVAVACTLIYAAGCSSSKPGIGTNPGVTAEPYNPKQAPVPSSANFSNLPKADANVPDAQFVELNSGYQIGALFYALSSGSLPDYEKLSMAVSPEYRSTADTFRKRDLMQGLKPQIDQQIQAYKDKRNRYFTAKVGGYLSAGNLLVLKHYDFKTNSFPLAQDMSPNTYYSFSDTPFYSYIFTNGSGFQQFPLRDEQKAREIEDLLTKNQIAQGYVTAYMFAQGADAANRRVQMQIVRMVLTGPGHNEFARH